MITPTYNTDNGAAFLKIRQGESVGLSITCDTNNNGTKLALNTSYNLTSKLYRDGQEVTFIGTAQTNAGTIETITYVMTATQSTAAGQGVYTLRMWISLKANVEVVENIGDFVIHLISADEAYPIPVTSAVVYDILNLTSVELSVTKVRRAMAVASARAARLMHRDVLSYCETYGWRQDIIIEVATMAALIVRIEIYDYSDERARAEMERHEGYIRALTVHNDPYAVGLANAVPDLGQTGSVKKVRQMI